MHTRHTDRETYIGIDIGGTKSAVLSGDREGRILSKEKFPTETWNGPEPALRRIEEIVREHISCAVENEDSVGSIGISCGGPLDSSAGIIQSPPNLPGWDNIEIRKRLEDSSGVPVFLQNDANACALAECRFGAGKGYRNIVFLTFGTGLGAGIILNGRLYEGSSGMAGEVGHIRLAEDGPVGYGKSGSFEGFCSGGGIAQLAREAALKRIKEGLPVDFLPETGDVNEITTRMVGESADAGDKTAISVLQTSGMWLGKGLSIIIDILNPEVIVIGSVFARARRFLQPAAEKVIQAEALAPASRVCRILPAGLGEKIGDVAALSVAIDGREHGRSSDNNLS